LSGVAFILGTVALILSKSRGAWVAYPFAMAGTVFLTYGKSIIRKNVFVKILGLAFLGIALIVSFSPFIIERFLGKDYQAMAVRMPLNKAALSIISQFPVFGVGLNNFSEVFKTYDVTGHAMIFRGYKHVVHNIYLLVATETGIVGLMAFLGIFAVPLFRAIKVFKYSGDEKSRGIVAGAIMGICAHLIHGLIVLVL
jgi:O-antigen ligase